MSNIDKEERHAKQVRAVERIASRDFSGSDDRERIAKRIWNRAEQFTGRKPYSWDYLTDHAAISQDDYGVIREDVLARAQSAIDGTYPPITSYEELELLPVGSIVTGAEGWWVFQSDYHGAAVEGVPRAIEWASGASWFKTEQIELPARLIHIPSGSE